MKDLNLLLFDKLREYDRYMRMNRAPGALLSASGSDSMDSPAFQRDIVLVLLSEHEDVWTKANLRSYGSQIGFCPEQYGQPLFLFVRLATDAIYSWPFLHIHHTFLLLPGMIFDGTRSPFLFGCHSEAISGYLVAKSLNPDRIC